MQKTIHRIEHLVVTELLRELRLSAGLKQAEVSERLGVTQSYISDVERNSRRVDVVELRDLLRIYGVSLLDYVSEMEIRLRKKRSVQPARRTPRVRAKVTARGE